MEDPTELRTPSSVPYVVAAVAVVLISTLAILCIILFHPGDNTALIAIVVASITPTSAAILAFIKAQDTHGMVNGRMGTLLAVTRAIAYREGLDAEKARAAALAVALATPVPPPAAPLP